MSRKNNPIARLIIDTHFNPDKPENMNILNTNIKDNRIKVYDYDDDDDEKWLIKDKKEICETLYYNCVYALFNSLTNTYHNGEINISKQSFERIISVITTYYNDIRVIKEYIKIISYVTYNNRHIVLDNIKKNKLNKLKTTKLI